VNRYENLVGIKKDMERRIGKNIDGLEDKK
jgi:hypothetical protein